MPHRVARLLTPPGLPLSSILQAAAAQAWSRRAHLDRTRTVATKVTSKVVTKVTPASSFTRAAPPHLQRPCATFENDVPDHCSARVATPTSSFTRAAESHLPHSQATSENDVSGRSSPKLATATDPTSGFASTAAPHLQFFSTIPENNVPDCSSVKSAAQTAPTCSFTRAAAPHFSPPPGTSANDVQEHPSRSTNERTGSATSECPAPKPVHNTSLHPHSRYHESLVEDLREIIPEPTPKMSDSLKPRVRPIKHKSLSTHDFDWRDPGRAADVEWPDLPLAIGTPVCTHTDTLPQSTMKQPTSPNDLYRNILRLTSNGPFTIRPVIDYYFECPESMHSTKSFNLLIGLALRNASFGGVGRLLNAMETEGIPPNMETWKLHVRWLVRTDRWNKAWQLVLSVTERKNASMMRPNDPMPLELWLELLGSQKRGALRHWIMGKRAPGVVDNMQPGPKSPWEYDTEIGFGSNAEADFRGGLEAGASLESRDQGGWGVVRDNSTDAVEPLPSQIHHGLEKQLVPLPWQRLPAVEQSQYRALMQVSPLRQASDDVKLSPRTILIITRAMLLVGQRSLALSTALSYLASLPRRLRRSDQLVLLDLVHLHLAMVTRHGKPGLKQHFAQRRMLRKFLDARPNLTPTSLTLFLLLGPLRGCRRGGTLAMQCLRLFDKRWGARRMQSKLVRRRIANLALKEGRLDIVRTVIKSEWKASWGVFYNDYPRFVSPTRRIKWREMFGRRGVWNRRWRMIEEKYHLRSTQSQRLFRR